MEESDFTAVSCRLGNVSNAISCFGCAVYLNAVLIPLISKILDLTGDRCRENYSLTVIGLLKGTACGNDNRILKLVEVRMNGNVRLDLGYLISVRIYPVLDILAVSRIYRSKERYVCALGKKSYRSSSVGVVLGDLIDVRYLNVKGYVDIKLGIVEDGVDISGYFFTV